MNHVYLLLIGTFFFTSCSGQNNPKANWETHIKPIDDQLTTLSIINDSTFNTLELQADKPLDKKFLAFRKARKTQHFLIDSIKNLINHTNKMDYFSYLKKHRELMLRDGNFEKIQKGEGGLHAIAQSIDELKDNASVKSLLTLKDITRENLQVNSENDLNYFSYNYQLFTSQTIYLSFENALIQLLPRFNERREGSGHPEHEEIDVAKYNGRYKSFDNFITIGDHKDKVVQLLGQPDRVMNHRREDSTSYVITYKYDDIYLHADTVIGWDNRDAGLKVKLESAFDTDPINHITIGTSKHEALALYGTPDEIEMKIVGDYRKLYLCHEKWGYGQDSDYLCFSYKDEVMEYQNKGGSFDIRLESSQGSTQYFTIGSTMAEVVAINGSPAELTTSKVDNKEHWNYFKGHKHGYIEFQDGKVKSVDNRGSILKFKY